MTALARRRLLRKATPVTSSSSLPSPLSLLSAALERGVDDGMLAQLIGFHERSLALEAHKAFEIALAAAKAGLPVIAKNRQAMLGRQAYRHEDLAEIARTVAPILARHGLSYRFRSSAEGGLVTVTCVIAHRDGHSEQTQLSAGADQSGEKNALQAIGSTLTYLQRMTLKAALGLAAADDDDGKAAGAGETITRQQARELIGLADKAGANRAAFLQTFGIRAFAELPASRFRQALTMLTPRKERS